MNSAASHIPFRFVLHSVSLVPFELQPKCVVAVIYLSIGSCLLLRQGTDPPWGAIGAVYSLFHFTSPLDHEAGPA